MKKESAISSKTAAQVKKTAASAQGRSFCCSVFIYTFVFVSGVVVATILPDLAGHHFKQPYGKEYAALAEQVVNDIPKYWKRFSETAVVLGRDVADRVWELKMDLQRRFENLNKKDDATTSKSGTQRTTTRPTTRAAPKKDHDHAAHDAH